MADINIIKDWSNAFGPSGFEEKVLKEVKKHCEGLELKNDAMNNVYASMPGKKGGRPVFMLDAHTDECGFMVQAIQENGLLSIITLGGFHMTSLPAHTVIVRTASGRKIKGITTSKPVHFMTAAQKADNSLAIEDILVDVGAVSRDEVVNELGIQVGDPIMPDVTFEYDEERGLCMGKAFDNRLGCMCIIETMQALKEESDQLAVDVVGAFASQEEVGMRGGDRPAGKTGYGHRIRGFSGRRFLLPRGNSTMLYARRRSDPPYGQQLCIQSGIHRVRS